MDPALNIDDPELDPERAGLYEAANPWGEDEEFFVGLVNRRPSARVVDLGCGTGRLAIALASAGHRVLAVDPNPAFLGIARQKPGADKVTWLRGTSRDLPDAAFDFALMTSHVAQVFLSDDEWASTLLDIRRALVRGGVLAFDSRDPAARAWERWRAEMTGRTRARHPDGSVTDDVTTMTFVDQVARFQSSSVRSDGARTLDPASFELVPGTYWSRARFGYRFRSLELVRGSLESAGFTVEEVFGGWRREPVGDGIGELVVIATAR